MKLPIQISRLGFMPVIRKYKRVDMRSSLLSKVLKIIVAAWCAASALSWTSFASAAGGEFELNVIDSDSAEPVAVRMQLFDSKMRAVKPKGFLHFADHFVFDGQAILKLPQGQYTFRMERGLEYRTRSGNFRIDQGAADNNSVQMVRFTDMAKEGWYSGDLSISRLPKDLPLLMLAEDLHIAGVTNLDLGTKPFEKVGKLRYFSATIEHHPTHTGQLSLGGVNLSNSRSQALAELSGDYPWSFLTRSNEQERTRRNVNLQQTFHWDLPVWLASKRIDSVSVMTAEADDGKQNRQRRPLGLRRPLGKRPPAKNKSPNAGPGRRPDPVVYASPSGIGRWSMEVYFRMLEAGFRIPPTAISRSGYSQLPAGANRVYVYCGDDFSFDNWWMNLQQGKCVLTNGPLIRPFVEGHPPGHIFRGYEGKTLALEIELRLSSRDKISYLEVIKDGKTFHEARLAEFKQKKGQLPKVEFKESGWFLIRAICDDQATYKYACSAPFYVDFEGRKRISKKATKFFYDWSQERLAQVKKDMKSKQLLSFHRGAVQFWKGRHEKANVE